MRPRDPPSWRLRLLPLRPGSYPSATQCNPVRRQRAPPARAPVRPGGGPGAIPGPAGVALAPRRLPPQNGGMKAIRSPRLAVRALILRDARLLLVNAYAGGISDLWCAPGGGVERHQSLDANLTREVFEETGLTVRVGALALISEFHDPAHDFHQVEMFYRCEISGGRLRDDWRDPDAVVNARHFFSAAELADLRFKPDLLAEVAFSPGGPVRYDPLEVIVP